MTLPPRLHDETAEEHARRCAAITGLATGGVVTNPPVLDQGGCIAPPLSDLGERPIDLDLSLAATPSGPFLALVADKRVQLTAQAALGRLLQGDTERAARLLSELDHDALTRIRDAATELAIGAGTMAAAEEAFLGNIDSFRPTGLLAPSGAAAEPAAPPAVRNAPGAGGPDAGTGTPDRTQTA